MTSLLGLSGPYLFHFLQGKYSLLNTRKRGTGTPHLDVEVLRGLRLRVPAPSEQERTVARLEGQLAQLDAAEARLKAVKEQLRAYRQAVLRAAFAKYHTFASLGQVSERIFDGPFGSNLKTADYVGRGIRVVRLENLRNAWFDDSKRSFISEEKYQTISSHTVYPDDLIMATFIAEDVKICQLPWDIGFAVNKADCIGIRLKEEMNPRFVMFYLSSQDMYFKLVNQVHGATRPRVNTRQIKALQIPITGLQEQNAVVSSIERRFSACEQMERSVETALRQSEALRQSILKKAFEGD